MIDNPSWATAAFAQEPAGAMLLAGVDGGYS
jgi:hypothetical protein